MRSSYDWGIAGRGSVFLGDASGTHFWQGQLCLLLLIGALVAKHQKHNMIAGFCAIGAPLLAVHFVLQMQGLLGYSQSWSAMGYSGSTSMKADPSFGSIALAVLSIPFAILAFHRTRTTTTITSEAYIPDEPTHTSKPVPWILVAMLAIQVCLSIVTITILYKGADYYLAYRGKGHYAFVLFVAALHLAMCRMRKWPHASYWSLVLVATAAINWIALIISSSYLDETSYGSATGSGLMHIAIKFSNVVVSVSPYTSALLSLLALLFAWSDHLNWKPKLGSLQIPPPRWANTTFASLIVLGYPLTVAAIDATKLDIPTELERQKAESVFLSLTMEPYNVFDATDPSDPNTLTIELHPEYTTKSIEYNDYGDVHVVYNMAINQHRDLIGRLKLNVSDNTLSETIQFRNDAGYEVLLTPQRNGFLRVVTSNLRDDRATKTELLACPSSTYMRRANTVRSLEGTLRAHSTFLSPRKQKVDLSSLSDELRMEVRALLQEGKAYTDFPTATQKRVEDENRGAAIPTNAIGPEPMAIAKEVLLAQDTAGVFEYRYEAVSPFAWVGLTDSSITLDHQLRFISLSGDGSGEVRTLRSYRSVFDTAGVLLASMETQRIQESVTTYDSDSTYLAEGIFLSAWCHEGCYVKFRVLKDGRTEEKQLLYLVKDKRIPLFLPVDGEGGAEDYTNHEMIGKRFLLTMKKTAVFSEEGGVEDPLPYWEESLVEIAPL
jgi:hypothetical protein